MRLAGAGLAVGEDADLEAVEGRLGQLRHLVEDLRLARALAEDAVELEAVLAARLARREQLERRRLDRARRRAHEGGALGGGGRAHAAEDADVALELRDRLVHLPAQVLHLARAACQVLDVGRARRATPRATPCRRAGRPRARGGGEARLGVGELRAQLGDLRLRRRARLRLRRLRRALGVEVGLPRLELLLEGRLLGGALLDLLGEGGVVLQEELEIRRLTRAARGRVRRRTTTTRGR